MIYLSESRGDIIHEKLHNEIHNWKEVILVYFFLYKAVCLYSEFHVKSCCTGDSSFLIKVVISESEMKMVFELGTWARVNLKTQNIRKIFSSGFVFFLNIINSKRLSHSYPMAHTQVEIDFSPLDVGQKKNIKSTLNKY